VTITLLEYPDDCVFHARVTCEGPPTAAVFEELAQALIHLKNHLDSGEATYIALSAFIDGAKVQPFLKVRIPVATVDELLPYAEFSAAFWNAALATPSARACLSEFLAKLEDFAQYATRDDGGIWCLCEHNEVMFGQPIFAYLAMQEIGFVPNYTRMLSHWRTEESSTWCAEDIVIILEKYGLRSETRALLDNYIANWGPEADEFQAMLDDAN
jgi:hypothetical protein